jgi:hypothetical protein
MCFSSLKFFVFKIVWDDLGFGWILTYLAFLTNILGVHWVIVVEDMMLKLLICFITCLGI